MKQLHIVSFDVPYPPNYGGVIDVFYKLKALHQLGIEIYLHAYEYGRGNPKALEQFCKKVFYYQRYSSVKSAFSRKPFVVKSRSSKSLIKNLKKIEAPILFDGLHTTSPLINESFEDRKTFVRAHNIEHLYYIGHARSEAKSYKKLFFKIEAKKLRLYEKILQKVDKILSISPSEHNYFSHKFFNKAVYIPVFHGNTKVMNLSNKGDYALYHGNLRIADNIKAAHFLIDIFKEINFPLLIAGNSNNDIILSMISKYDHIKYVDIKDQDHISELFANAHINVLPTFQKTGIKLKLINTLFNSRFCVVNNEMVEDTGLEDLCEIGGTKEEFSQKIVELINKEYSDTMVEQREKALKPFNTKINAQKIIDLLD